MNQSAPHYLLYSSCVNAVSSDAPTPGGESAERSPPVVGGARLGRWTFVLQSADGEQRLAAEDVEPIRGGRLELLSVIRGLEALEQPSRVTLVTSSRYVGQGLRYGIDNWRRNGWQWERFGVMAPIKNGDLWQRLDLALRYHEVECRVHSATASDALSQRFRVDRPQPPAAPQPSAPQPSATSQTAWRRREVQSWRRRFWRWAAAAAAAFPLLHRWA